MKVHQIALRAAAIALLACGTLPTASAQDATADIMKKLGLESTRAIDGDIAFPADSDEYDALGKNAVVMVKASSVVASELPLRSVYAIVKGVRVPLRRVALSGKRYDPSNQNTSQVSFYIVPIQLLKGSVELKADFNGGRTGFGFMSFGKGGATENSAAFVRLDEYDSPSEPDMAVLNTMLAREYPDQFHGDQ